jgi:tetratricopeptide (TPR) repeat protein
MQAALEVIDAKLRSPEFVWPSDGTVDSTRLCRQQIWCLISLANLRYEAGNPSDARLALNNAKIGIDHLDTAKAPCHGTRYHLCHIEGLLLRDEGNLNEALLSFSRAMRHARHRMQEVSRKRPSEYRREARYFRVCQARTLAFGLAESDFLRGAFLRAESLFTSALPTLDEMSTPNYGASRWKTLVELYLLQCQALTTDFDDHNATSDLAQIADGIAEIRKALEGVKVHHEYRRLATVFRIWTLLRLEQVKKDRDHWYPMLAVLSPAIEEELKRLHDELGPWSNGPIGRLIKRVHCEALIRTRSPEASDTLEMYEDHMKSINISQTEFRLLRAEILILRNQETDAKVILDAILLRRELGARQRIWAKALRARITRNQLLDEELAREGIRDAVSSAYLRAQIQFVKDRGLGSVEDAI